MDYCCVNTSCSESFQVISFVFSTISPFEIYKTINTLKQSWVSDWNEISINLLKRCALNIVQILAYLFNKSILEGVFTTALKRTMGYRDSAENYRPIILLSVISKNFECVTKYKILSTFKNELDVFLFLRKTLWGTTI